MNLYIILFLTSILITISSGLSEGASIEIVGESGTSSIVAALDEVFEVKVVVDLNSKWSDGIEIYIGYDPEMLAPVDANPLTDPVEPFSRGELFKGVELANFVEDRLIGYSIGVLPDSGSPVTGSGIAAVARFRPLKVGTTRLTFKASDEDWNRGRYTLLTLSDTGVRGSFKARSFSSLKGAEVRIFRLIPFTLIPPSNLTILEDSEGVLDLKELVRWRDVERPIRWSCLSEKLITEIDPNHVLHVKPYPNWKGEADVLITARVEGAPDQSMLLHVTVTPDPSDPIIKDLPQIQFRAKSEGYKLNVDRYVEDSDTPLRSITWRVEGNMLVQARFDKDERCITFSCDRDWHGEEIVTLVAEDPEGNFDLKEVKIVVLPPEKFEFNLREYDEITLQEGAPSRSISLDAYVLSASFDLKRIKWEVSGNERIGVSIAANIATLTPQQGWTGSETLTFRARAPDGTFKEMKLKVSVFPKPLAKGEFKIAVIRNPIFKGRLSLLILTPSGLDPRTISISVYLDDKRIEVKTVQNDIDVWLGWISLPRAASGKLRVVISAQDVSGLKFKEGVKEVDL